MSGLPRSLKLVSVEVGGWKVLLVGSFQMIRGAIVVSWKVAIVMVDVGD